MYRLILCFLLLSGTVQAQNPQLTIEIQNIEVEKGKITIGVFTKNDIFLKVSSVYKSYSVAVRKNTETITIKDLPKGEYAFIIYQDKNSDGKLNENALGIPKEPFVFSNNVRPKFSKPTFEDCKFSLASNRVMKVRLDYYNK